MYSINDDKILNLGKNIYKDEEIFLSKFKTSENWKLNNHYCYKVTSKTSPFREQHTRMIWFDWDPVTWEAVNPLNKEDFSWLKVYVSSEDNVYGKSFMNKWYDGQVFKTYIQTGVYKSISLKVIRG